MFRKGKNILGKKKLERVVCLAKKGVQKIGNTISKLTASMVQTLDRTSYKPSSQSNQSNPTKPNLTSLVVQLRASLVQTLVYQTNYGLSLWSNQTNQSIRFLQHYLRSLTFALPQITWLSSLPNLLMLDYMKPPSSHAGDRDDNG